MWILLHKFAYLISIIASKVAPIFDLKCNNILQFFYWLNKTIPYCSILVFRFCHFFSGPAAEPSLDLVEEDLDDESRLWFNEKAWRKSLHPFSHIISRVKYNTLVVFHCNDCQVHLLHTPHCHSMNMSSEWFSKYVSRVLEMTSLIGTLMFQ